MNNTVNNSGVIQVPGHHHLQDLKWGQSHGLHCLKKKKKAQQRLYFLRQLRKFNLPQELLKQFYSAIIESVLCTSITLWFSSATKSDLRRLRRVVRTAERIIVTTPPYSPRTVLIQSEQKGWQNHSGPLTSSTLPLWTVYRLVDATELWAPERPDTGTVSSPEQSISWTLDNKCGTHTNYTLIYLTLIRSLHFNLHIIYMYIQRQFVYYYLFTYSIFNSSFYCVFVLSLSFCCTVEASVTKTNSLYV